MTVSELTLLYAELERAKNDAVIGPYLGIFMAFITGLFTACGWWVLAAICLLVVYFNTSGQKKTERKIQRLQESIAAWQSSM